MPELEMDIIILIMERYSLIIEKNMLKVKKR